MARMEEIKNIINWYQQMGVNEIQLDQPGQLIKKTPLKVNLPNGEGLIAQARAIADQCSSLLELRQALENFEGLSIKKTANNTMFSDGNAEAEIMVIGEAPGANEDEEGIPSHHVSKFHMIAAVIPEKITGRLIYVSITDFETVLAIPNSPMMNFAIKNATTLKKAAHKTALNGVSTFVETIVAIEFAAS